MINKKIAILCLTALLFACSSKGQSNSESIVSGKPTDFEVLCDQFDQLTKDSVFPAMDTEARAARITNGLKTKLSSESNAYIAWLAIQNGPPEERYNLFLEAASSVGEKNWTCPAIEKYGHEIGSNFE